MVELEDQLRAYGAALDTVIDDERFASTRQPATERSSGSTLGRLVAAGLVVASIAGVAALMVNRESNPDDVVAAPTTSASARTIGEPAEDWPAMAVGACADHATTVPTDFGVRPTATDASTIIPIGDGRESVRVTIIGVETTIGCTVSRSATGSMLSDISYGLNRPRPPVAADGVVVDDQAWMSQTDEGRTGPGWYDVTGRAGTDVVAIVIELSDGTTAEADLSDGNFYGRIDVAAGVPLFDEVLTWTLTDGTTRSSRGDLVDSVSAEEQCASTPGCVDQRLVELRSTASPVEAEVLADGDVTEGEYQAALQRVADCANAAGAQVTVIGSTLSVTNSETDPAAFERCQAEHLEVIGEAWYLLDARDRIEAGS